MGNILIVEDDPNIRKLVRVNLIKRGYTVSEAEDSHQAIALFQAVPVDLVLLDLLVLLLVLSDLLLLVLLDLLLLDLLLLDLLLILLPLLLHRFKIFAILPSGHPIKGSPIEGAFSVSRS